MYKEFYRFNWLPFEATPDPRFYYASEQHREALAAIEYTIRLRKGVVLITGEIGSGKTTVGCMMCKNCGDQGSIIQIVPRHCSGVDLLRQVLRNVQISAEPDEGYPILIERLQAYLADQMRQHKPVVLFVDEAQSLCDDALEELRVLSNLNTPDQKLIQVVLVGHPELRQRIRRPQYDALRQRIVLAKQLKPFSAEETASYIAHRLATASIDPQDVQAQFSSGAIREIHRVTEGVPRLINITCDNCLLLGSVRQTKQITPAMVHQVIQDMVPRFDDTAGSSDGQPSTLSLAGNF